MSFRCGRLFLSIPFWLGRARFRFMIECVTTPKRCSVIFDTVPDVF